jgi:hypothetical protein
MKSTYFIEVVLNHISPSPGIFVAATKMASSIYITIGPSWTLKPSKPLEKYSVIPWWYPWNFWKNLSHLASLNSSHASGCASIYEVSYNSFLGRVPLVELFITWFLEKWLKVNMQITKWIGYVKVNDELKWKWRLGRIVRNENRVKGWNLGHLWVALKQSETTHWPIQIRGRIMTILLGWIDMGGHDLGLWLLGLDQGSTNDHSLWASDKWWMKMV